ncbi:MAG TPA: hypothetical protein VFG14_05410, partial [Chthoniobacteraceae bacterium]|nr:hypothetical protein [Chthoniobacteraceae bacterium]
FEQVYGAPYLARLLFAELGRGTASNVFLRLDYDGGIHTNGGAFGRSFEQFGVIAGTKVATNHMEEYLRGQELPNLSFKEALLLASKTWAVGHLTLNAEARDDAPDKSAIAADLKEQLAATSVECAVLERGSGLPMTWRSIPDTDARSILEKA